MAGLLLQDITRKEKGGHGGDEDGEEDEDTRQYMATDHGPTAYHRLSEEFDLLDRTASVSTIAHFSLTCWFFLSRSSKHTLHRSLLLS